MVQGFGFAMAAGAACSGASATIAGATSAAPMTRAAVNVA
jgi:hypothetical protein